MNLNLIPLITFFCFFISCNNEKSIESNQIVDEVFQNEGHELVYKMVQKVGSYKKLASYEGVEYTYTYKTPDNKTDISNEKYFFENELSYGEYVKHERTLPELEGVIEQGYDGNEFWLKHNGNILKEENYLKRVKFNRPTNYYWFTMMQKLLDPGLKYEYLGDKVIEGGSYDIVKVTFESVDDKPTDIYQLYINKETLLVDQFLFTVADFGKMEIPNLMKVKYEEIQGILIPTKRKYKKSTWDALVTDEPWVEVNWSNIKFKNKIRKEDFAK